MLNFNLTQNIQIIQSYYVKLKLGYVKIQHKILTRIWVDHF